MQGTTDEPACETTRQMLLSILRRAQDCTGAKHGILYLLEKQRIPKRQKNELSFKKLLVPFGELQNQPTFETSAANIEGMVATNGKTRYYNDVHNPAHPIDPIIGDLRLRNEPRVDSILATPIKNLKGSTIGVIVLFNGKHFAKHDETLTESLAQNAAIAFENIRLTNEITNLFESFVQASVKAIESRDPTTAGHSDRVAALTVEFAKTVDRDTSPKFADVRFSANQIQEIRYASLLHDFGKIGVREDILLKGKKLSAPDLENLFTRLRVLKLENETAGWKQLAHQFADLLKNKKTTDCDKKISEHVHGVDCFNAKVEEMKEQIEMANEPNVLAEEVDLKQIVAWLDGIKKSNLQVPVTPNQLEKLCLPRGTLTREEKFEIESHVTHTYRFLRHIVWTENLARVPEIAFAHHERLNGTGYPRKLTQEQIPLQAQMMAITDIYDALTALDRPYKKAVSLERALDILTLEVKQGKLNADLLKIFIEARLYLITSNSTEKRSAA